MIKALTPEQARLMHDALAITIGTYARRRADPALTEEELEEAAARHVRFIAEQAHYAGPEPTLDLAEEASNAFVVLNVRYNNLYHHPDRWEIRCAIDAFKREIEADMRAAKMKLPENIRRWRRR
jgi:hypothetical protein